MHAIWEGGPRVVAHGCILDAQFEIVTFGISETGILIFRYSGSD